MENINLKNGLELMPDERACVLHEVVGTDSVNRQPIRICCLEPMDISLLLSSCPFRVRTVPDIFCNTKEDCM